MARALTGARYVSASQPVFTGIPGCLLVLLLCLSGRALPAAQDALPLVGFVHRAWTARTGAPAEVSDFAQTNDGMLWVASTSGLFRFDGLRFLEFHGKPGGRLSLDSVYSLYAPPTGGLWVGLRYGGVAFLQEDKITEYPPGEVLPDSTVTALSQDRGGTLWAATPVGLLRLTGGQWEKAGAEWGLPPGYAATLIVDRYGAVWVCMKDGLYVLHAGSNRFSKEPLALSNATFSNQHGTLAGSADGTLWVAGIAKGIKPAHVDETVVFPEATAVQFDREGALWFSSGEDVRRLTNPHEVLEKRAAPSIEHFGRGDGLIGDASVFFEDREGDIWVGSGEGIDLFVPGDLRIVRTLPVEYAMARARDGSIWWAESHDNETGWRIEHFDNNKVEEVLDIADPITCAYTDPGGNLWFAGPNKVWQFDGKKLMLLPSLTAAPGLATQGLVRGRDGSLWRSMVRGGVFRYDQGDWQRNGGLDSLPQDTALVMAADQSGRLYFGYTNNRLAIVDGSEVKILGPEDGLDIGNVTAIEIHGDHVWIGGEHGLLRFDGNRFYRARVPGDDPYRNLWGVVETQGGELWAAGGRLLIRLTHSQLADILAGRVPEQPPQLFDYRDGVVGQIQTLRPLPALKEAADGRLWFAMTNGLGFVDVSGIAPKTIPPPSLILTIRSGGREYSPFDRSISLPPHSTRLRIGYTSPSFAAPERVRFRYKLKGVDKDWQYVGEQREAVYTNLSPGAYGFEVGAADRDSAWSEPGAELQFTILPAFYQTRWFDALCCLCACGLLGLLYSWRMRQVTATMQARLEERIAERERIARELHDTLLQGFQGLMLRLQAVSHRVRGEPEQAHQLIEQTLERADAVLEEGRDRVAGLRTTTNTPLDLPQVFLRAVEAAQPHESKVRITVEGAPRRLAPIVREEAEKIGIEAMTNALLHAQASVIEVEILFLRRRFALRVSDDGIGIDPVILAAGRERHFGLTGMRERARGIRGEMSIASRRGGGTEIELTLSSRIAYVARRRTLQRWWRIRRKSTDLGHDNR